MKLDSATWSRVAELFDAVIDMAPGERRRWLDEHAPSGDVREHLDRLLDAHDTPDPLVVDETIDDIVGRMLDEKAGEVERIPEDLAGRVFGNWRAMEEIGRGGMSVVLRGERADERFEKKVAIKLLPPGPTTPGRRERLEAEIRVLARLEHPGVARLIDGGVTDEGMPFLVMEYVDGIPITRYCERHRSSLEERIRLAMEAADALAYSHGRLVVHCDIKPSNVLVDRDGRVKLVDFGIAAMLADEDGEHSIQPILRCSPAHAAPEQLKGESPAVTQDVFALGSVLYELLAGRRIRDARQATGVVFGESPGDDITPPSEAAPGDSSTAPGAAIRRLNGDLDAICLKALAGNPRDRYPAVEPLIRDLRNWLENRPVAARDGGRPYRAGKWIRRHRWTTMAASLAALSLLGGSGLALWQAERAERAAEIAQTETARAENALAETEQALQRAEALHEFLLDLFRAADPDRPREQLPDTGELLSLGARRAMEEDSAPAGERLGMLMTIGKIYISLNRYEDAEPLFAEAVDLARDNAEKRPEALARALVQQARLFMGPGMLDRAEEALTEAESLVADRPTAWNIFARARLERAWVARHRVRHDLALELLRPLHAQMTERTDVEPRTRALLLDNLAGVHARLGNLDSAADFRERATRAFRESAGPEHRAYATSLANGAGLQRQLGRFEQAESRARQAIELYDRIYDRPMDFRASARRNLARTLLSMGHHEEALETLDASGREWAAFQRQPFEEWPYHFITRGSFLARMGRLDEAAGDLEHARELLGAPRGDHRVYINVVDTLRAWVACRMNKGKTGARLLDRVEKRHGDSLPETPDRRAQLHEARAACYLETGEPASALQEIEAALAAETAPGQVVHRADRLMLKAGILAALGRHEEAAESLGRAEALFAELDLANHPKLARVRSERTRLVAEQ